MLADVAAAPGRRLGRSAARPPEPEFWALRDVSFEVPPGQVVAVIGRNGAGKSTLLKVLSRITEPTSGRVELRGRVASLLEVGTGFHPDLTGRENVSLNGAILGMGRDEIRRKFDAIVDFAEISRFVDTPVKRYSSGMYLRLAFAVAAHLDGEILLVDEVLAVGDAAFQQKCLGKMQDVSRGGRTVLFISHNMSAVSALCTRAILLESGQVASDGAVADGVRQYLARHLDEAAHTWPLDAVRRTDPDLGHGARLTEAAAVMPHAEGFAFGEPMRFRLAFTSAVPLDGLVCALNVDDLTGYRLVTFESNETPIRPLAAGPGRCELDITVPPFGLRPGKYLLSASLFSGGRYYDYLIHFGVLSILPFEAGKSAPFDDRPDRGPIKVSSSWRVVTQAETVHA
jgi:lipopolysaccharide transport system ATP-binding protein